MAIKLVYPISVAGSDSGLGKTVVNTDKVFEYSDNELDCFTLTL
ncbi:hypothetical protein M23134_06183 [Microscilla marina ATCC 23134]|uniref:Uncharacterized protein n=1 Tax=Microscilla marina ATCC 23134 TaxID=313606 RepID=A1ZVQ7_MICM2|nr:hypothetical protein M23134_06183 [Microscilla marina ATCC 23134]